jgi:hypothetical protein
LLLVRVVVLLVLHGQQGSIKGTRLKLRVKACARAKSR